MITRRNLLITGSAAITAGALYLAFKPGSPTDQPFRIGLISRSEINTLEPSQAATESPISIVWNIYDRLVQLSEAGDLEPRLAERWESNDRRDKWRFAIRSGVRFHDSGYGAGRTLGPSDVVFSIHRAVRLPGYARTLLVDVVEGVSDFLEGRANSIRGIRIDGDTVEFQLSRSFSFLPDRLAASYLSIVPEGTPDEGDTPAGTGAYALTAWDRTAQRITLRRFEGHWQKLSPDAPSEIVVRSVPSEALGAAELKSGGIDYAEFNATAYPAMNGQAGTLYRIREYDHTELRLIALNQQKPPFSTPHGATLGRALNLGIDRDILVRTLDGGTPFAGPVPTRPTERFQLPFDRAVARSLVDTVPKELRRIDLLVEPVDEARIIAELLVPQWSEIGLTVTAIYGRADFFPVVINGDYQMALAYYGPYIPSPEQYLWMYRADAAPVPNVMRFSNDTFEAAFTRYTAALSDTAAESALDQALAALLQQSPTVWVMKPPRYYASRRAVEIPRSAGLPVYARMKFQPPIG
ncbi:hypothetical protein GCM10017083_41550 [Thalassobaculum fulvum]|uniref:Solute-binding protein family 5 domain-containing protein n=1 Tax=Thalassobaculum fulvum TaxID=1633335 RepID=A0A918XWK9_9PROT|nr:ABC transporter substrate-binding protein [Thalassobaculum fulvum]GHD58499.1 hypothetical protein GCM10017083_41550 [Thalassobaculum fulvum]